MSKLPIAVSPADESGNSLTVTFTKKDFSDFVFNLFVTPREERHNFFLGFDLFKDNLKKIVEKLEQHIQSNHEVLNRSLLIDVILKDGVELTYKSHEQFFNVDDPRSGKVDSIAVTFSHVIAFFREGKKSFERQQTSIRFSAGKMGQIEVAIRSTDISWPNGIFALLERELTDLSAQTAGPHSKVVRRSPSSVFDAEPDSAFLDTMFSVRFGLLQRSIAGITSMIFAFFVIVTVSFAAVSIIFSLRSSPALVLSDDATKIVQTSLEKLIEERGFEEAIKRLQDAATLKEAGMPVETKPTSLMITDYLSNLPHTIYILGAVVSIAVFIFSWSVYARRVAFEGRILIYSPKVQSRATPSVLSSVLPALALGAMASLLATAIWEGLK